MSPPPPPPPPSSGEEMQHLQHASMYNTPPQRHSKSYGYSYGYMARRRTANAGSLDAHKSPAASPATSASSAASPSHLQKTKSASDVLSPRVRGRMDPYPRYSPRKRLSADFSDGTYSAGTESPKSEKGGWRIHAAVHGPFLTGPLANDFVNNVVSPRGKKEEQGFDDAGLLLFPVVPAYVAPAITPEVFQASIQPQPQVEQQPQPEPDHSVAAPAQDDACFYPDSTYNQQPTETPAAEASWDASAQQQQYYQEEQQQYYQATAEEQQYYAEQQQYYQATSEEQQQYYQATAELQAAYYYYGGYDQQQYDAANYGYEQAYEQSYEQYQAVSSEQPAAEPVAPSAEEFPPLPHHEVATPAVADATESVSIEQAAEPLPAAPQSPVQRPRAPSYAEIVSGAAQSSPRKSKTEETAQAPRKVSFNAFDQLSEGIAESMSRILAKSQDSKTSHAEVEFTCVVRRIQTQLKLMGKVTKNLHLEQVKTMHKLQQSEIEKLSIESANQELLQQIKKYEEEQEQLKQQLADALQAKDDRLKAAVDQLTQRLDALKSSTDASTAKMALSSESDDLEMRVQEIGDLLDFLVKNQTSAPSTTALARKNDSGRQSSGSWKTVALCSLVACAASVSGAWVGINYADDIQHFGTAQPVALEQAAVETILSQIVDDAPASYASQIVEIIENDAAAEIANVIVPEAVVAPFEPVVSEEVVEMEVAADLSSTAAVVDVIEAPAVSANWISESALVAAPVVEEPVEEIVVEDEINEVAEVAEVVEVVEEVEIVEDVVEAAEEVAVVETVAVEAVPEVVEAAVETVEAPAEVEEVVEEVVIPAEVVEAEEINEAVEAASPLNGLARALGSLSSSILAETAPVAAQVEEVIAEEASPVQVETPEVAVVENDDVSGSVVESVDAEAVVEVVETVEVAAVEAVEVEQVEAVEYSNSTASTSFETALPEPLAFVAEPVAVEAVEEAARSRWAQEQFLVEVGASCGLEAEPVAEAVAEAEVVVDEAAVAAVADVAFVAETELEVSSEWFLEEQPLTFSNVSTAVFVETETIEKVDVTESAPEDDMCSAPVFDLKTQLLTSL